MNKLDQARKRKKYILIYSATGYQGYIDFSLPRGVLTQGSIDFVLEHVAKNNLLHIDEVMVTNIIPIR